MRVMLFYDKKISNTRLVLTIMFAINTKKCKENNNKNKIRAKITLFVANLKFPLLLFSLF